MNDDRRSWLDVLTDGQLIRDWLSLNAHFVFGAFYWALFSTLLGLGLSLVVVIIGVPLLLLGIAALRHVAAADHEVMAALLGRPAKRIDNDVNLRGANLLQRFGLLLGSAGTWRSLVYLGVKLPVGVITVTAAWALLPLIALEVLILGPLTIDLNLITVRLLHWLAQVAHDGPALLLPTAPEPADEKAKRELRVWRLERIDEDDDLPEYMLTDDGEIVQKRRA